MHHAHTQTFAQASRLGFHRSRGSGSPWFARSVARQPSDRHATAVFCCLFFGRGLASAPPSTGTAAPESVDGPAEVLPWARAAALGGVTSLPREVGAGPLSLTNRARIRGLSVYRTWFAHPFRRLLIELGEAWSSLS